MKPVSQQIINPLNGDCLRACIASLLEFGIEKVPNFTDGLNAGYSGVEMANRWLDQYGLALFETDWLSGHACWFALDNVHCIFSVPSQLFEGSTHAVVGRIWLNDGILSWAIVHDPNPKNKPYPIEADIKRVSFLVKRC